MAEKRGRKRKNGLYFGPEQEEAIVRFLKEPNHIIRNRIYNKHLRAAFDTMIESIIRKYRLYRKNYTFENLHSDTLSYLILKADKFKPETGNRAYSYYGTVCKHYILGLVIKDAKYQKQTLDLDSSLSKIHDNEKFTYSLSDTNYELSHFIKTISDEILFELENDGLDGKKKMTENERKVGEALVDILTNWEIIFDNLKGGSKFNKNAILATIRENTGLVTKDIRISMRRYKKIYNIIKTNKIDEGYI